MIKSLNIFFALVIAPVLAFSQQDTFKSYTQELENVAKGIDMVAIPEGLAKLGNAKDKSQVQVKLDAFWIGKYEIPWDIYELFVFKSADVTKKGKDEKAVDGVTRPTPPYLDMTFGMGKNGFPAVGMTQYNAIQFCKWLYLTTGIFYRLPTEAEWEYACRAGSTTAYFFDDNPEQLGKYAWFADNSEGKTHPLGSKEPNVWGIYDMYGNAAEWTADQYVSDYYKQFKGKIADNPTTLPTKLYPIAIRGGSFKDAADRVTSSGRIASDPDWKIRDPQTPKSNWWFPDAPFVGLRIVRPVKSPSKADIDSYYNKKPIVDY